MPILEPVYSRNIVLSKEAQDALRYAGVEVTTFDDLVGEMAQLVMEMATLRGLSAKVESLTAAELPSQASAYGLKSGSIEAARLPTKKAALVRQGDTLTYDFNEIIKGVPADMAVVSSTAVLTGPNGKGRVADSGNAGVLQIPGDKSAIRLEVNVQTKKGVITLSSSMLVPEEDGQAEVTLGVNDYTTAPSGMTVAEHLAILSAEVAAMKQKSMT